MTKGYREIRGCVMDKVGDISWTFVFPRSAHGFLKQINSKILEYHSKRQWSESELGCQRELQNLKEQILTCIKQAHLIKSDIPKRLATETKEYDWDRVQTDRDILRAIDLVSGYEWDETPHSTLPLSVVKYKRLSSKIERFRRNPLWLDISIRSYCMQDEMDFYLGKDGLFAAEKALFSAFREEEIFATKFKYAAALLVLWRTAPSKEISSAFAKGLVEVDGDYKKFGVDKSCYKRLRSALAKRKEEEWCREIIEEFQKLSEDEISFPNAQVMKVLLENFAIITYGYIKNQSSSAMKFIEALLCGDLLDKHFIKKNIPQIVSFIKIDPKKVALYLQRVKSHFWLKTSAVIIGLLAVSIAAAIFTCGASACFLLIIGLAMKAYSALSIVAPVLSLSGAFAFYLFKRKRRLNRHAKKTVVAFANIIEQRSPNTPNSTLKLKTRCDTSNNTSPADSAQETPGNTNRSSIFHDVTTQHAGLMAHSIFRRSRSQEHLPQDGHGLLSEERAVQRDLFLEFEGARRREGCMECHTP